MDQKRAPSPALGGSGHKPGRLQSAGTLKRLQHLLWAGAIALVMLAVLLLMPVSQFSWLLQSRLGGHQPSGDIVFVGTSSKIEEPSQVSERQKLTEALRHLDQAGVQKIYLDFVLHRGTDAQVDAELAQTIAGLGDRVVLVDHLRNTSSGGGQSRVRSAEMFRTRLPRVAADYTPDFILGYTWQDALQYEMGPGEIRQSLAASMAGIDGSQAAQFHIDYGFDPGLITSVDVDQLVEGEATGLPELSRKVVLIGPATSEGSSTAKVPGRFIASPSLISIYSAESLKSGRTKFVSGFVVVGVLSLLLGLLILSNPVKRVRRLGYAALVLALPAALFIGAQVGVRMDLPYAGVLLLVYALFRSRARWRMRVASIDGETGLPKLRVLEKSLAKLDAVSGHIVIARLHGFEHAVKTLGSAERSRYVHRLVDRLRAADSDLVIYIDGHYLAWKSDESVSERLIDHLEGLRAIFAAPIMVGSESVDVGITFGVANLAEAGANAVAAAAAAAEETSEAHVPIKLAEIASRHDELWDISLRARIDSAMQAGEIYCVYQPKVDTIAGTLTGVEALVRWHDPERGFIPPMKFIAQCEKAGRMEHLTQYVLQTACNAGRLLHFRGTTISMSVNISATLLGDMRIVGIVRNTLQATGFDARHLILEITETSRIGDLETAAAILSELKSLGLKISIDDFGVGSANFETLFGLPFDELKIDRLFVDSISRSKKAKAITSSMIAMGNAARITVVAEGAEDEKTLQILNEIGCRYVQGYALARPLSLTNLLEYKVYPEESKTGT